jgi:ABC-2 type transport system permease protein
MDAGRGGRVSVRLVAEREMRERARSRAFVVATAIMLVASLAGVIVPAALRDEGPPTYDVGLVGSVPAVEREALEAAAHALEARLRMVGLPDRAAAAAALRDERADLALLGGQEVLVREPPDPDSGLAALATSAARAAGLAAALPPDAAEAALEARPLPVRALQAAEEERAAERGVAFVGLLVLYATLLVTGMWVATGVVQEKSSRVVELLAAVVPARSLLAGKVLGIGLVGLAQLAVIGVPTATALLTVGGKTFPQASALTVVWVVVWFVLGYALYGCLYAASGALAGRIEDIQSVTMPLTAAVIASYFVALVAVDAPDSTLARVTSFIPPTAPMAMVPRLALGEVSVWETALSIALMLVAIAGALVLAARIYAGAILRTGRRTRLRDAWRAPMVSAPRTEARSLGR